MGSKKKEKEEKEDLLEDDGVSSEFFLSERLSKVPIMDELWLSHWGIENSQSPEKLLYASILIRAIHDLITFKRSKSAISDVTQHVHNKDSALSGEERLVSLVCRYKSWNALTAWEWIESNLPARDKTEKNKITFLECCEILEISPGNIRKLLRDDDLDPNVAAIEKILRHLYRRLSPSMLEELQSAPQ